MDFVADLNASTTNLRRHLKGAVRPWFSKMLGKPSSNVAVHDAQA